MTIPVSTKNAMLDALAVDAASLHSGFPGVTGTNEISGGAYARQTVSFASSSGGSRSLSGSATWSVPPSTVRWVGWWAGSQFVGCTPNGGATPRNFMALTTDLFYAASHGYSDDQTVVFFQGTPPAPLSEGTVYYVRDATTDTFKVSASAGGPAIDLTGAPSFGVVVCAITEDVYAGSALHVLATASLVIPD